VKVEIKREKQDVNAITGVYLLILIITSIERS